MITDFSVRVKNKISEKNVYIAVTRSCRFHMHGRAIRCSSVLKSSACKFSDEKMNQIIYSLN